MHYIQIISNQELCIKIIMGDSKVLTAFEQDFLFRADSGAIRFKVRTSANCVPEIVFSSKRDPLLILYKICLGHHTKLFNMTHGQKETVKFTLNDSNFQEFKEFWLTYNNFKMKMGLIGEDPFLVYNMNKEHIIGFVNFQRNRFRNGLANSIEWMFEESPLVKQPLKRKYFDSGLQWCTMINGKLPPEAMIGGFDNNGPIYIARAQHNGSLCPGKYVPSKGLAFIPWGHREHTKQDFEVLCGYNGEWIKTKSNLIPLNAFIGGHSEVYNQPLYIGRAMHQGNLLVGKVHVLYKTCYLPYRDKEVEVSEYEILVVPEMKVHDHSNCVTLSTSVASVA